MPNQINLSHNSVYEFQLKELSGFIRPRGHYHGLTLFANGHPITRPGTCTINLEHYCARGDGSGCFVPRNQCQTTYNVDSDRLSISFEETETWKVKSMMTFQLQDDDCIDVSFDFAFSQSYARFEAFIASYFYEQRIPFLRVGEEWIQPHIEPKQQLFFTRDDDGSELVVDGRWDWLKERGLCAENDGRKYSLPIIVAWNQENHRALIQMVEFTKCSAVSVNTFAYAQDLSLIGEDVYAGQQVSAKVRLLYREVRDLEAVVEWYEAWDTDNQTTKIQ